MVLSSGPLRLKSCQGSWHLWCHSSSFSSHPCLGERPAQQSSEQKGKPGSLSNPTLGTNAFFLGQQWGPLYERSPVHLGHHSLEDPREKRFKGQTSSSPESCPDHLISVPNLLHQPLFSPKGYSWSHLHWLLSFKSLEQSAFSVTSSKECYDSDKLFKEEVRVIIFRDFWMSPPIFNSSVQMPVWGSWAASDIEMAASDLSPSTFLVILEPGRSTSWKCWRCLTL